MARIDWALVCELAFFDRQDRLCLVGITRRFCLANLPFAIGQTTIVARIADIRPVEEIAISVAVVTPSGGWTTPTSAEGVEVQMDGEYVLATLHGIPLTEEGIYGFQITLRGQPAVSVDIPVLTIQPSALASQVH